MAITTKKKKTRNSKKKFKEEVQLQQGEDDVSCIPETTTKTRKPPVMVYCVTRHLRRTIDHSKYTNARTERTGELFFATRKEVDKYARKLEAENPDYYYYTASTFVDPDGLDRKFIAKLKAEFHLKRTDI